MRLGCYGIDMHCKTQIWTHVHTEIFRNTNRLYSIATYVKTISTIWTTNWHDKALMIRDSKLPFIRPVIKLLETLLYNKRFVSTSVQQSIIYEPSMNLKQHVSCICISLCSVSLPASHAARVSRCIVDCMSFIDSPDCTGQHLTRLTNSTVVWNSTARSMQAVAVLMASDRWRRPTVRHSDRFSPKQCTPITTTLQFVEAVTTRLRLEFREPHPTSTALDRRRTTMPTYKRRAHRRHCRHHRPPSGRLRSVREDNSALFRCLIPEVAARSSSTVVPMSPLPTERRTARWSDPIASDRASSCCNISRQYFLAGRIRRRPV